MKKLCPNLDREDGLETVLEVPIPDEIFSNKSGTNRAWENMKAWMKPNVVAEQRSSSSSTTKSSSVFRGRTTEIQLLLGVVGAPLVPFPITSENQPITTRIIKDHNIEASMAKYIVKQYVAAVGGESAMNSVESMYAMGEVRVGTSEFSSGEKGFENKKKMVMKSEMGGFVVWQKKMIPAEVWCLELVVSGYKISAGSDGKVAWRQTPWHHSHASKGPPRPLRRLLQGLDPRSTANLFNNSICIGEKTVNKEECFTLQIKAEPASLRARSSSNVEIIRHTMWGYFSQRTGLLVQLQDTYLLKLKTSEHSGDTIFWETNMESLIHDYKTVDGIRIAHAGKTIVTLSRFGEGPQSHSRTRMEEEWKIEEVDFNIKGLSMDCFLAPSDLMKRDNEDHNHGKGVDYDKRKDAKLPFMIQSASFKINASKVAAIDDEVDDSNGDSESDDEE